MDKYKKLMKNSGIFFVANFGSKILSFLLVSVYTHVLTSAEYGIADIVVTTISFIVPLFTLSISEAALRFAMDKNINLENIISNCIFILCIGGVLVVICHPLLIKIRVIEEYIFIFYILLFANGTNIVLAQLCRGAGYVKEYAVSGIISTVVLISSNIILLLWVRMGVSGYLVSIIISYIVSSIYICCILRINEIKFQLNKVLMKKMVIYSAPMIPNAFSWWAITAADKYVLLYYVGTTANGIYVVAQKLPSIINMISGLFLQSWQLSAVDEAMAEDQENFYSQVFSFLSTSMILVTSLIILILKPLCTIWIAEEYFITWKYIPILLLANMFSCYSQFVGTNYMVMKKTMGNLKTAFLGCVINIILNLVLIPQFGIHGASISTFISFLVTWIFRVIDTKKYVKLKIDFFSIIISCTIIFSQYILQMMDMTIILQVNLFVLLCFFHKKNIRKMVGGVKSIIKRRMMYGRKN